MRVHVAQVIPAGAGPVGHGVGLPFGRSAAFRAGGVDPVGHLGEGAFAVVGGLIALDIREDQGQLALVQRNPAAFVTVNKRDRFAPVALTREDPVAQLVIDLFLADPVLDTVLFHGGDRLANGHAVHEAGVDHDAVVLGDKGFFRHIAALDHLDDGQVELHGELPVALVMARHAHDAAGAVAHEDVVRDKDRNRSAVHGVDGTDAMEADTGFVLIQLAALEVGLLGCGGLIGGNLIPVGEDGLPLLKDRMLGRDDHIGHAVKGVGTGGVDGNLVAVGHREDDLDAGGAADPVLLLDLDALDIIQIVQIVNETVGVLGYGQHPLALLLPDDLAAAALADAVNDLFVGKAYLAAGAPVDGHGGLVGQTVLEHLEEDPLRPLIIVRVRGIDTAVPVKAVAQHLELARKVGDVVAGHDGRMDVILNGKVLGREAEGVIADGENDIVPVHALFARDDIHGREGPRMADMQAGSAGVRKLNQTVKLRTRVAGNGGVGLFLFPDVLPFFLNGSKIIFHNKRTSLC